jgi:hypothetical protein
MWDFLGGAVGALGSIYGANVAADTAQKNMEMQQQINATNIAEQEKFAQTGIQWKVADAKAAGINPLAALGASTSSFSNVVAPQNDSGAAIAQAYGKAGQSLGGALSRIQTQEQRDTAAANTALDLQNKQLNNQYIQARINEINRPGTAAGVPVPTSKVTPQALDSPGVAAQPMTPDIQYTRTADGGITVTPPHDVAAEGFFHPASLSWYIRNGLLPAFGSNVPAGLEDRAFEPGTMTYLKPGEKNWANRLSDWAHPFGGKGRTFFGYQY